MKEALSDWWGTRVMPVLRNTAHQRTAQNESASTTQICQYLLRHNILQHPQGIGQQWSNGSKRNSKNFHRHCHCAYRYVIQWKGRSYHLKDPPPVESFPSLSWQKAEGLLPFLFHISILLFPPFPVLPNHRQQWKKSTSL